VFDIGVPSVVNDFSSAATVTATASVNFIITASSGAAQTIAATAGSSSQSSSPGNNSASQQESKGIGTGALVGIAVGIITFAVLTGAAVVAYCCMKRRKTNNLQHSQNLIDVNGPNPAVGVVSPAYTGQAVKYPGSPQTSGWDPSPPYNKEYYASNQDLLPKGPNGVTLIELQSSPAQPIDNHGHHMHELA
jgi:hypothetical protein